jgi:16S rRNA (cytidine1402-2'-O)-methyltransferase
MLYIVPTPIGNLKDITLRALDILKEADLILAEDTRTSSKLLNHYSITCPLTPFHQHNEHKVLHHLVDQLLQGKKMALISDAGTPGISDPAFLLVRECIRVGVAVECLPGATAFVPALINSGLPSNRFAFEGFLPVKKGRQSLLKKLATEERTLLFYESPHRLVRTLEEFIVYFGKTRHCGVSRELTKLHEENFRGTLEEALLHFGQYEVKGELVIVVEGAEME